MLGKGNWHTYLKTHCWAIFNNFSLFGTSRRGISARMWKRILYILIYYSQFWPKDRFCDGSFFFFFFFFVECEIRMIQLMTFLRNFCGLLYILTYFQNNIILQKKLGSALPSFTYRVLSILLLKTAKFRIIFCASVYVTIFNLFPFDQ